MPTDILMPQLGESVVEGTIICWLKQPGDSIEEFEALLEVTTDKVDTEIPSTVSGTVSELLLPEGSIVAVGSVIARVQPNQQYEVVDAAAPQPIVESAPPRFISPVAARLVAHHQLDIQFIGGTGAGGRVNRADVEAYLADHPAAPAETDREEADQPAIVAPGPGFDADVVPLSPMRHAIAKHMVSSKQTAPHATAVLEVNMSHVIAQREAYNTLWAHEGTHLTLTAYFVQATARALRAIPSINATFSEEGIIRHRHCHVGIAVAVADGLVVPVIRDADTLSFAQLARILADLTARGRGRALRAEELRGGTFTISNYGSSGSLFATPIINQPQAAILGVGTVHKRPVVISKDGIDMLAIQSMCYLSLSFDHRLIDGSIAGAFLMTIKQTLEGIDGPET